MKAIPLSMLCMLCHFVASAQEHTRWVFMQYNHYYYTSKTYTYEQLISSRKRGFPIGIQVVKNRTPHRAVRTGVTFTEHQLISPPISLPQNKQISTHYKIFAPTFMLGEEWQYHPVTPLVFTMGADIGFGLMKNGIEHKEEIQGQGSYSSQTSMDGYAYNMNASITPFVGARLVLSPFVMGYEMSMPMRWIHVFNGPSEITAGQGMHRMYIGYVKNFQEVSRGGCRQRF